MLGMPLSNVMVRANTVVYMHVIKLNSNIYSYVMCISHRNNRYYQINIYYFCDISPARIHFQPMIFKSKK